MYKNFCAPSFSSGRDCIKGIVFMKDKTARALAIVALVFMGLFVAALVATLVDVTLLNGSIGYIALGTGIVGILIFVVLKMDGRGFSVTQINNELEMEKIKREMEEAQKEVDENAKADSRSEASAESAASQNGDDVDKTQDAQE